MTKRLVVIFIAFLMLLILNPYLSTQSEYVKYEGKIINEIIPKNLINTNKELILGILSNNNIEKGKKFNYQTLRDNFKKLYDLGFFSNISVDIEEASGGKINLIITFEENPKVGAIAIEGENDIDEKDIISVMILKPGNVFRESYLDKDRESILSLYKSKGFEGTEIQVRARTGANKKLVNIIVQIKEGEEVYVESIKIIGTKNLDPDDIYDVMDTKESTLLRSGQTLNERKLIADRIAIVQYMKDHGYFLAKIKSVKKKKALVDPKNLKKKKKGFFIVIEVEEGLQFKMGDVTIKGNKVFKTKFLHSLIKSKKDEIFNDSKFKADLQTIRSQYFNRGYIQVQVISNPRIDTTKKIIHWDIDIVEGEKVHIEQQRITGHEKSMIWVIDRELRLFEGEIYNHKKIIDSINRLRNTQYYKNIEPQFERGSEDGLIKINYKITEQRTGLITIGAGYGTLTGFSVFEEVQEKNFLGRGWLIRERVEWGQRRKNIELGTSTNWLFRYTPIQFSLNLRWLKDTIDASYSLKNGIIQSGTEYTYDLEAWEVDMSLGYFLTDYWLIFSGFLFSISKANNPKNFALSDLDSSTVRGNALYQDLYSGITTDKYLIKVSHRIGFIYDTRDVHLNPRKGFRIKGLFTYTGGILGGDSQWLKWENEYNYYINPLWNFVLAFRFGYTMLFKQFNGTFEIRDFDRLRFDGLNELRGWRSIYTDEIVGQGGKISMSFEIRFPLFTEILWGVLFADSGDVTDTHGSLPSKIQYYSFGFGFRIEIPLIPIRLYFAKKADYGITTPKTFTFREMEVVFTVGGYF